MPSIAPLRARAITGPIAGRYVLLDHLGTGGTGSVWRAWDRTDRQYVAAKVLGLGAARHRAVLLRFVHEQSVRIAHPHVVAPTGWAAEDDLVLITMDLVAGGSLADLLSEHGRLPESYVATLLEQVLRALAAVHAAGVVHRDVKPANLLLEVTSGGLPHVRLADFGIAAVIDQAQPTGSSGPIGSAGYAAPEQEEGPPPDPRADLYAAGVVARTSLTGRPPTSTAGRDLSPGSALGPVLTALTQPDPDRRPASAADALVLLSACAVPPWAPRPGGPVVRDRLASDPAADPARAATLVAVVCFAGSIALSLLAAAHLF